jgi:hypothetical protein
MGVPGLINDAASVTYPLRPGGASAFGFVTELGAIPVREWVLGSIQLGPSRKMALISILSRDLAQRSDGTTVIKTLLREDCAASMDTAMFSTAAGSTSTMAGLLNGVSALTGFAGGDRTAMETDLKALFDVVAPHGSGEIVLIMSQARALTFAVKYPDVYANLTILGSNALAADRVIAVDPRGIIFAVDSDPDIDISENATVHMDTEPLPISDSGVAAPVRSLFQTGSLGVRIIADVAWVRRATNTVSYVDGVTW